VEAFASTPFFCIAIDAMHQWIGIAASSSKDKYWVLTISLSADIEQ